ncbi:MAG TPA: rod shape-determining protein MreC [Thermoleophilia bacterium]|nr:rod shape-determining protein MreC [Thermoleophilia bacterium]
MKRRRVLRRRIVVAVLLLLCVAMLTLYFRESDSGPVHAVQGAVLSVVQPLQSGTSRVTQPFRNGWNWVSDLFHAKSENGQLRVEVRQLRAGLAQQLTTQDENAQLRAMVDLQKDPLFPKGLQLVAARVIARSTSAWYSTVTIDAGSNAGIAIYDAVINGDGLVGRVTKVSPTAAQVTLITDQQSYVDAVVLPGDLKGGAQGILAGSVTGDTTLQYVDKNAKVQVGQYVMTSGTSGRLDSLFVRGIPIGQVESVGHQEVELYQSVAVRPFVDFHKLDLVQVVVR